MEQGFVKAGLLRNFVESDSYTIAKKAAMMVDHFHEQVIARGKIGGQARAMVVTLYGAGVRQSRSGTYPPQ